MIPQIPQADSSSSPSMTENGLATVVGFAKSGIGLTPHSDAESTIPAREMAESNMRAIHLSNEPKSHKTGPSLAERRSTTQTPLQLDLAHAQSAFADAHPSHERSQAIDIPTVKRNLRDPVTPLTARAEKSGHFSYFQPSCGSPLRSPSLRPRYHPTPVRKDFTASNMHPDYSSSNASSTSSPPSVASSGSTTSSAAYEPFPVGSLRHHRQRLNQVGRSTSSPTTQSSAVEPRTPTKPKSPSLSRVLRSPQPHHRQVSDAQRKLQQYQRDLIANATRASGPLTAGGRLEKPDTPHLKACGSPGTGPATPMMLEDPGDYLSVGMTRSTDYRSTGLLTSSVGAAEGLSRDLVDQLLLREESRRVSGMSSPGGSPAISPAGGPR